MNNIIWSREGSIEMFEIFENFESWIEKFVKFVFKYNFLRRKKNLIKWKIEFIIKMNVLIWQREMESYFKD